MEKYGFRLQSLELQHFIHKTNMKIMTVQHAIHKNLGFVTKIPPQKKQNKENAEFLS